MSRPFEIEIAESEEELKKRIQTANLGNQKEKLQMLWWIKSGQVKEQKEIGLRLAKDTSTVTRWLQKYRSGGLSELLKIKTAPGASPKIPDAVIAVLEQELNNEVGFSSYGAIVEWLKKEYELEVKYGTVYALVHYKLGAKLKVPRPQSYKQDQELVSKFKKKLGLVLSSLEKLLAQGKCVHYLCQDETRLGLKTLTGKVITAAGVKPTVQIKWQRDNFWIYGAIEPLTGRHFQQEYPKLNGEYFQKFLDWLSQQLGNDYAILQIDQAPAHTSAAICWPENIIPLLQPPHSPELNPTERLWQFLKKSLKNELFSSLQNLRDSIQRLFTQLTFEQVMSVSSYNFILEALFYAASY